jgi:threonine dehydratase
MAKHGGTLIHPYNDFAVIAGQGTIGLEVAEDCAARGLVPDTLLIPCGGGGLSSGVGLALRDAYPSIALTLVEPDGFDDYRRSLVADRIVANTATAGSICDALLAPSPGDIGFALNRANHARAVSVSDADALAAVAFAFRELKLVVEPGGAVGLAALLSGKVAARGETVVVVLSGGNIDPPVLARALAENP